MSKNSIEFKVRVIFSDQITSDDDINEIAENIARAIKNEANGMGISPDESDFYTTAVEVKALPSLGWEVYLEI